MGSFRDLKGVVFGRLTVVSKAPPSSEKIKWFCQCVCGKTSVVAGSKLVGGKTKSCGCLRKDQARQLGKYNKTHGQNLSPEYKALMQAIGRCHNENHRCYLDYGGRGLTVCETWRNDPELFLRYMGPKPSPKASLDRIDNNQGYSKENCRWATSREQNHNKRKRKNCSSRYIGVCWSTSCNKWEAKIRVEPEGIQKHLGYFTEELAAAVAYDESSAEAFGDKPNEKLIKDKKE